MANKKIPLESCSWERQDGETEKQWEAFRTFRDLGEGRSVQSVCDQLLKSRQMISRWKTRWFWDDRVRDYDNELQKEAFKHAVKEKREMNKRHIKLSLKLQEAALAALENKDFADMSGRDITNFIRLAAELERSARNDALALEQRDVQTEERKDDVVIYVPENGLGKVGGKNE